MRAVCIIVAAAALCLAPSRSALAIATEFVAFTGSNADPIHSSEIAKVDTRFQLPVYFGWPARDYEIIGTVYVHADETPASRLEIMRSAVAAAKARGADAFMAHYVNPNVVTDVLFSGFALRWKKVK